MFNAVLYNLQAPNTNIAWKKRAEEAEASPQQRMIERYINYQSQDKGLRAFFLTNIAAIKNRLKMDLNFF